MSSDDQAEKECPLCMEQLDLDELNFFPCKCGYQICQFCWNRIKEEENGLCPACRQPYPEQPADFKPLTAEELKKIQLERRKREQQRKQKMSENRKHLANLRVVQRNLVLVHGLPPRLADAEILKRLEYFGQFGKIFKIVIGTNNIANNAAQLNNASTAQVAAASVYVTYNKEDDAVKAILALNQKQLDGRVLRASLGTTKYCSSFLQNKPCQKTDCMYLHEVGDSEASFTKEDMAAKKHEEYERKVCEQIMTRISLNRPTSSPPPNRDVFPSACNENNGILGKCRDDSAILTSTASQLNESLSQSPTPMTRHSHTKNNPPPRHRNRPQSQMQLMNESKCATNSVDSVVDHVQQSGGGQQGQSPEPSDLHRSSTIDNSLIAATSTSDLPPSVSALLHNGFCMMTSSSSTINSSTGAMNIVVDQNDSPSPSSNTPMPVISASSLPTSVNSAFFQQKPATILQQQQQLASSLNAKIQQQQQQQLSASSSSIANWQNSRILAAIQQQQNQSNSQSLFSHDDDAFYRPKLKQIFIQKQQQHELADESATTPVAEFSGANKSGSAASLNSNAIPLVNGLSNGGLEHNIVATSKSLESRVVGDTEKSSTHEDIFVPGDSLNVKSHTDWQAAFGFGKTDDDLGFDPFSESSKALEDMVREEKEQYEKQQRRDQIVFSRQLQQQHAAQHLRFQHHQQQQQQLLQARQQQKSQQNQHLQSLWSLQSQSNLHFPGSSGGGHSSFNSDANASHPGFMSPGLYRPNSSSDLPPNKLLNGALPNYNGLNAQAAPFVPRQIIPPQQQQQSNLNMKEMQEQFKEMFPNANVKFATHLNQPPPSAAPPTSGFMLPNSARSASTNWPHRMPDPRQAMFTRPPPPLATNGPPLGFPRPPMKLSPTGSELPFPPHHHPRISGPQFPPAPNASVFSDFSGWSSAAPGGLAPTPPPGFAPTHQNSS